MGALTDAVIALLKAHLTDLEGRVFVSIVPPDEVVPAAAVDVTANHDPVLGSGEAARGIEYASVVVRITTEDVADVDDDDDDNDSTTGIGTLAIDCMDALTGSAPGGTAPPLVVPGYVVLDAVPSQAKTYATHERGKRYAHAQVIADITLEKNP